MKKTKFKQTEIGMIPEDWEIDTLGNHADLIKGISYRSEDYCSEDEGFIFINLKCVARNGGFRHDGIKYYKGELSEEQFVNPGDILIANTDITQNKEVIGSPVKVPPLKDNRKICISLDLSKLEVTSKKLNNDFLYYYLMSPKARHFMFANSNGTTVVHLSTKNVPNLIMSLPNVKEQEKITKILSDLDSKIELNQRVNKALEEISRAIFKRWFVDFEFPNENGKPYKSSGGEMVDSELGGTPKGWRVEKAINFFKLEYGWHLPSWDRKEGKIPVFGSGGLSGYHNEGFVKGAGIIIGRAGKIGSDSIYYSHKDFCPLETTFYVLTNNKLLIRYLYFFIKTMSMVNTGSSVPNLSRNSIHDCEIIIPDLDIIQRFDILIEKLFDMKYRNEEEIKNLSQIRDSLLPRLMSGKIRVLVEVIEK